MTLRTIALAALTAQGYDGLHNEAGECACVLADLAPCNQPSLDCKAGYRQPCDCGDHAFHIGAREVAPEERRA